MYLSRFTIDPERRGARSLLSSRHRLHAAIEATFDRERDRTAGRTLWRIDGLATSAPVLYVLAPSEPKRPYLVDGHDRVATGEVSTRSYEPLLDRLETGQRWAFRLAANPVQNAHNDKNPAPRTKRYGHVTVAQQRDWLLCRAERAGFGVTKTSSGERDLIVHDRSTTRFERDGSAVTLRIAAYDGVLEVTDPDALRRTLVQGIGHAKAYGCGLLTLAPVP